MMTWAGFAQCLNHLSNQLQAMASRETVRYGLLALLAVPVLGGFMLSLLISCLDLEKPFPEDDHPYSFRSALHDLNGHPSLKESCRNKIIEATTEEVLKSVKRPFHERIRGFPFIDADLPGNPRYWVKYGFNSDLFEAEADTQTYVCAELAKAGEDLKESFYIPRVFDFIETEIDGMSYGIIVMEFVTGHPISGIAADLERSQKAPEKEEKLSPYKARVADFICWLLSLQDPPDTAPGPVGGGRIINFIFGRDDPEAPHRFFDLEDLQDDINKSNKRDGLKLPPLNFKSEQLRLCCCDLNLENFLLEDPTDPSSRVTILDFEHTNWLPHSFLIWALWDKKERLMEQHILAHCRLHVNEANVYALDEYQFQRNWPAGVWRRVPRTADMLDAISESSRDDT